MIEKTLLSILQTAWPSFVIFLTIIILVRLSYLISTNSKIVIYKELYMLLFVAYILLLFELVTYSDVSFSGTNFVPFKEILRYKIGSSAFNNQVLGNILLFIPFGYFVASITKMKKVPGILLLTFCVSTVIEVVQYYIGRCFDIDDIILNMVGGLAGFLLYIGLYAIWNHLPKLFRRDWFLNILMIIVIILAVLFFMKKLSLGWI